MDVQGWYLLPGLVLAGLGAVLGWLVPRLIARIPEPEPDEQELEADVAVPTVDGASEPETRAADQPSPAAEPVGEEPKELYADIAAHPGLAWKSGLAGAVVLGLVAARVGWDTVLLPIAYLVPVGVALSVVDWRTRLLPTKVIAPSYVVLVVLVVLAALPGGDWDDLLRAALGWLAAGVTFFVLWFVYPRGMGYGDVRLSGLLGMVLGYLGWAELVTGLYAAFVIGGVGGLLLSQLKIVDRKAYPFGPFMLVGAVVGVVLGPAVAAWYA